LLRLRLSLLVLFTLCFEQVSLAQYSCIEIFHQQREENIQLDEFLGQRSLDELNPVINEAYLAELKLRQNPTIEISHAVAVIFLKTPTQTNLYQLWEALNLMTPHTSIVQLRQLKTKSEFDEFIELADYQLFQTLGALRLMTRLERKRVIEDIDAWKSALLDVRRQMYRNLGHGLFFPLPTTPRSHYRAKQSEKK
jgi:hypothetical protein